jgi:Fe-S-cluster containining protein
MSEPSPCTACGACCATYRVSFYWAEAEPLPAALTRPLGRWYACMAGTERPQPRCEALAGAIGGAVACTVYDQRPSPCRELQPGEDKCQRARRRHGLPPLGIALPAEVLAPAVAVVAPLPAGALDPMPLAVPAPDPQEPAQPLH